jgi:hypothetical protein
VLSVTRCHNCNEPAAAKDGGRFLCSNCWFNIWAPREMLHGSKERNFGNVERHGLANSRPKHQSGGKLVHASRIMAEGQFSREAVKRACEVQAAWERIQRG